MDSHHLSGQNTRMLISSSPLYAPRGAAEFVVGTRTHSQETMLGETLAPCSTANAFERCLVDSVEHSQPAQHRHEVSGLVGGLAISAHGLAVGKTRARRGLTEVALAHMPLLTLGMSSTPWRRPRW